MLLLVSYVNKVYCNQADTDPQSLVAKFLLHLREELKVSDVTCSFVASNFHSFINFVVHCENHESPVIDAFNKFSSMENLDSYISEQPNYIAPLMKTVALTAIEENQKNIKIHLDIPRRRLTQNSKN